MLNSLKNIEFANRDALIERKAELKLSRVMQNYQALNNSSVHRSVPGI
ncbi:MAG: hypothetical protein M3O67_03745 [Bacteroidota bacterium]|nr:hypothetical protein [Bacteroidota bacterium]